MTNAAKTSTKADVGRLKEAMAKYGMKVAHGEGIDSLASRLSRFFKENADPAEKSPRELVDCSFCSAQLFNELVDCPFCGMAEGDSPPPLIAGGAKPASLAVVPPTDLVPSGRVQTEKLLDEAVAEIHKLKATSAASYWDLGLKIKQLFEAGLWKQRIDDKGKPRWKGFDAFAQHELGIGPQNALKMMDVAKTFSRAQVEAFGSKKFSLVLEAPPEDREVLVQKIEGGASKRDVEREVRALKEEKGFRVPNKRDEAGRPTPGQRRAKKAAKAASATNLPAPKPAEEKITVATTLKREVVKLFQKPDKKILSDPKKWKRCKRVADQPWGTTELANGVTATFLVQASPNGDLSLVVEYKREET